MFSNENNELNFLIIRKGEKPILNTILIEHIQWDQNFDAEICTRNIGLE